MPDLSYYVQEYLLGKPAVIPIQEFDFWAKKARAVVDEWTYGRTAAMQELPEKVKDCICAISEVMYQADTARKESLEAGAAGPLTAYSNDGESGSYATDQNSIITEKGEKEKIAGIIFRYLAFTGLLGAAVNVRKW